MKRLSDGFQSFANESALFSHSERAEEALKGIEPDSLSPKEALEILYDLKRKLQ